MEAFASRATLVIAHNAAFDRPFVEKQWDVFATKPWGCSMTQVHWRDEGIATQKQELIALCLGFFYEAHRAENDCRALLHILAGTLPLSGQSGPEASARPRHGRRRPHLGHRVLRSRRRIC